MESVRVMFSRRRALGSAALRVALWSQWSHVAIIDGDEIVEAAAFAGVRVRSLEAAIADASQFEIVEIPVASERAVVDAARTQIGRGYDWFGVIGIGLRRRVQSSSRWFCSELVAWSFAHAGYPLVRVQEWRITPRDLYLPLYPRPAAACCGREVHTA